MNLEDDALSPTADAAAAESASERVGRVAPFPEELRPNIDHLVFEDGKEVDPSLPFPEELKPNIDHLVFEDGEPVESLYFERLMRLLVETLYASWEGPGEGRTFAAYANVGLFAEPKQTPLVPDVMVSLDVPVGRDLSRKENNSYLVWVMGKPPDVVVEFVSDRRGGEAGLKMRQYARLRVTYYVIFDPRELLREGVLRAFSLRDGAYEAIDPRLFPAVGLGLVLWDGEYEGDHAPWLRWCDRDGNLLPTARERMLQAQQRAEQERQRAERLAAHLRSLGVDPDTIM